MPAFAAPQAYGQRGKALITAQKERKEIAEEQAAAAEKRKARVAAILKRKQGKGKKVVETLTEEEVEAWKLFFMIAFGIFLALAEALDIDVVIGILLMPFMKGMQWLSVQLDNGNLDPQVWIDAVGKAYNHLCTEVPGGFVAADFTFFGLMVLLILFEADISKWWRERHLRAQGYDGLDESDENFEQGLTDVSLERLFDSFDVSGDGLISGGEMGAAIKKVFGEVEPALIAEMMAVADTDGSGEVDLEEFKVIMRSGPEKLGKLDKVRDAMTDPDEMQIMLRNAREALEEVDLLEKLRGEGVEPYLKAEYKERRAKLEEQVATLGGLLSALETEAAEEVDLEAAAREAEEAEARKKREGGCGEMTKTAVGILKNTISGVLTIYLYFMDLKSDYDVTMLYYNTGAMSFAVVSAGLLIGQFLVVWLRVLPYLHVTYGPDSTFYRVFLYIGMPLGCFFFDALMFLGPFGLLPIAPMSEAMRLFVPAYGATRMIAEVLVEALPQWIMQAVIFVMVSEHVRDDIRNGEPADEVDLTLYTYNGTVDHHLDVNHPEAYHAGSFVTVMPKSILFSTFTMLKTWYDLVQEAREAGVSVATKGVQLWNVGAGLPLDAIKSGSITAWGCSYEISDQEVVSLVDALGKNDSLERLDLSVAGFEWMPPVQREERSAISSLLEVMNADGKALEALEKLVISRRTNWEIPTAALRSGPEQAQKSLMEASFLSKGGPEREEMHAMFELLCRNCNPDPGESEVDMSSAFVTKVFEAAQKGGAPRKEDDKRKKRAAWQASVAQLMVKGMTRRSHFKLVVSAEVLRNVGFGAQELLDLRFSEEELKAGFFEARELKIAGFTPARLKGLGYTPKDMWEAEISAVEMKKLSYTARELRDGGYTAQDMKDAACYSLAELRDGRYKPAELSAVGYYVPELREAGFSALDLRKAMVFQVGMMREAGYTAIEMKKAGYDAKRVCEAGYSAVQASEAGYTVPQMFAAGFPAGGVRKAGHSASTLREAGYVLGDLMGAGYPAEELVEAGYTVKEIKEAGTSLVQLKAAGTPMATLKDSGYTAERLKQQGYTAAELACGARRRVDIKTGSVGRDEGAYTARELRQGGISASELRKGKVEDSYLRKIIGKSTDPVFFRVEEWKDGGWKIKELREGGYASTEMKVMGYKALELHKQGYTIQELVDAKYPVKELKACGATAAELREAGVSAKVLSGVGYTAKELLQAGFSAEEVYACGFGVAALREAGFDAIALRALGFSAKELKAYGYGAQALNEAGCRVKELKELGFTDEELLEAGFTARAVEAVDGRSVRILKLAGSYEVAELKEYGYVVADLKGVYTVKDMREHGFSLDELRKGRIPEHAVQAVDGRPTRELRATGLPAKILRRIGYDLYELVEGGYTASELKHAQYDSAELKEAGFDAGKLLVAGFTSRQLQAARYTLREMQEGGFFWKDLVIFLRATHADLTKAGYVDLDPLHELFLLYRPQEVEYEPNMHDVSVLSPRHRTAGGSCDGPVSPHASPRQDFVGDSHMTAETDLKVRVGVALTSRVAPARFIGAGTKLRILDSRILRTDGTRRMCVAPASTEEGSASSLLPLGWVTAQPPPGASTRPEQWMSTPMAPPRSAFPPPAYLAPTHLPAPRIASGGTRDDSFTTPIRPNFSSELGSLDA